MTEWRIGDKVLRLVEGDIVSIEADALVNAANASLILGGGVAGAIRTAGGPTIQEECNRLGPISVGEVVMTGGGNLKAKHVIHAVGPVYGEGNEDIKLKNATLNSLKIAGKHNLRNIVFPAVSTGIFHFPIKRCSEIMLATALEYMESNDHPREVIFCLYGQQAFSIFAETLETITRDRQPE